MSAPLSAAETSPASTAMKPAGDYYAYIGSGAASGGIALSYFDSRTGALSAPTVTVAAQAPNFFVVSADGRHLYSCNAGRTFQGQPGGGVSAFARDPATGALTALNALPTGGADPGYISFDRTGKFLFVANYNGGSIAAFSLKADGALAERVAFDQHTGTSIDPQRQAHAYCEAILPSPDNRFILSTDLGVDKVFIYRLDTKTGALTPHEPAFARVKPGSGPRRCVFSPDGHFLYLIGEMGNVIIAFAWDNAKGTLTERDTVSTLPAGYTGAAGAAEIAFGPGGKFLYASNRDTTNAGRDTIAVFAQDAATGKLTLVEHVPSGGRTPRTFTIDPTGKWLVVTNNAGASNNAVVFKIDSATGKLTQSGAPITTPSQPLGVLFVPVTGTK
ncbi:MAG: lactonase family protein [Verrucomicrobiota bacterium]